jgi:Kyakuja-Dileera-Zisupton transposase
MGAFDGNNSLKRFLRADRQGDSTSFESNYFLPHDYVDQFKYEVKGRVRKPDNTKVRTFRLYLQ